MAHFSGLILSTIVQKNKQDFEFKLTEVEDRFRRNAENK